jgi:hypothetical protein
MSAAIALFLAGLLAASAVHKLTARDRLAPIAARLARSPQGLGMPLLLGAATLEAVAAIALILPDLRSIGATTAAALWLAYGALLGARLGERMDCGCDLFAREKPVDLLAVARPLLLAALAGAQLVMPAAPLTLDAPFAALGLIALWFAAGELAVLPHLAKVSRR